MIYPYRNECCGGYVTLEDKALAAEKERQGAGQRRMEMGAEHDHHRLPALPLQPDAKTPRSHELPVYYFTELLAEALGVKVRKEGMMHANKNGSGDRSCRIKRRRYPLKCMRCGKCSGTCPSYDEMEYHPHQFVYMVEKGEIEKLMASKSLYKCLSCFACVERCPRERGARQAGRGGPPRGHPPAGTRTI